MFSTFILLSSSSVTCGDLEYDISTGSAVVLGLNDSTETILNLVIPPTISINDFEYNVTGIDAYAFYYCDKLTGTVTFPDTLETIGECAFYSCNHLSGSLIIPDSVQSLGEYAFCITSISSVHISESITTLPSAVFFFLFLSSNR